MSEWDEYVESRMARFSEEKKARIRQLAHETKGLEHYDKVLPGVIPKDLLGLRDAILKHEEERDN